MVYGDKLYKPYKPFYPTPTDIPLDTTCVTIALPENPAFIGLWIGVLLLLCDPDNFVQFDGGISPETTAEIFRDALLDALTLTEISCPVMVDAPYWDLATTADDQAPSDEQVWYGAVTDWLAPADELNFEQNIALWLLTGFVAYAAGVGAAIFFRTTAKQFVIAVEGQDVGEIIRIVVDSANYHIDTTGRAGEIIEQVVVADPDLEEHDIYVIKGEFP